MLPYGDPTDPGNMTGPIVNAAQLAKIDGMVQQAVADGARVVVGGGIATQFETGFWFQPTLLADVTNDMAIARDEIFGPVLVAIPYDDDDDAVRIANDSIFGLSGAVVSADRARALAVAAGSAPARCRSTGASGTPLTCPSAATSSPGSAARWVWPASRSTSSRSPSPSPPR